MTASNSRAPLRVLVVTPLGRGGMGGIDRIMDEVRPRVAVPGPDGVSVSFVASRGKGHIALSPLYTLGVSLRLLGRPFGFGPDMLHVNLSSHGSALRKLAITRLATALGLPYAIHLHGSGFREYWDGAGPALSAQIQAMFAGAARVLALGSVWRDYIAARAPEAAARIVILPNATPGPAVLPPFRPKGPVRILFLGYVGPRKGAPDLVRALASLKDRSDWRAVIAGNGEVEETRREVERLGIADRADLPGWVGPERVRALLAESDVVVLPSYEENLPMSVIEGMAYGRAVIATPVGAVEDIVKDGETGLLVPVGDSDALARALARLLDDPQLRASIGAAAAEYHRRNLDMDVYVARLKAIWRDAALARA
jgi:glycosyltransferase involved in cell wall biosynthesis